jgi:hypothetical protein
MLDAQSHDIGLNHAISTTYLPGARRVDDIADTSLDGWREGAGAFLTGTDEVVTVRTTVWDLRNGG